MLIQRSFFNREADVVARELIGMSLCRKAHEKIERYPIIETEAYMGPHDLACHASKGRTKRTEVMFWEAGTIYVYLINGMYEMLNIVTGLVGYPAAVLIRGAGEWNGPGKLTSALGIKRDLNGESLSKSIGLWIEKNSTKHSLKIIETPRIGIPYAKEWKDTPLRFIADL